MCCCCKDREKQKMIHLKGLTAKVLRYIEYVMNKSRKRITSSGPHMNNPHMKWLSRAVDCISCTINWLCSPAHVSWFNLQFNHCIDVINKLIKYDDSKYFHHVHNIPTAKHLLIYNFLSQFTFDYFIFPPAYMLDNIYICMQHIHFFHYCKSHLRYCTTFKSPNSITHEVLNFISKLGIHLQIPATYSHHGQSREACKISSCVFQPPLTGFESLGWPSSKRKK